MDEVRVVIETELGEIILAIYPKLAPLTTANFLRYVNERRFERACFYRVVRMDNQPDNDIKIDVIQGGLFDDDHPQALPPVMHESTRQTGISHLNGTISMARNEPGSASSEFFICIGDQPELDFGGRRNPDGQGFAAFGKVINGMDVVHEIQMLSANGQYLTKRVYIESIFVANEKAAGINK